MSKSLIIYLLLLVPIMLANSCKTFENIEIKGVENIRFHGIEDNFVYFSVGLQVSNPSGLSFKIKEVNLKTVADGDYVGTLQCNDDIRISSRCDSVYTVAMSLQLSNIFTGAGTLYRISRQHEVKLEVKGYIRIRSFLLAKKIDINKSQVVEVPKIR
ncbi:MAG: hypothetical protein JW973_05625 [Bacteroidales bacterium]|nr:hypothetical protein [Bacteroidales bacterium]